ncbi:MAG: response regulator [Nitrospinae bacterium]|nr:response regulator [Nitrospinota bacterium]
MERGAAEELHYCHSVINTIDEHVYSFRFCGDQVASVFHNPQCETISGYTPQEHYARPGLWYDMVHEEDRERVMRHFENLEGAVPIEHRIVRKDGSVRWVSNSCVATRDRRGKVVRLDGFLIDISERKVMEEALRKAKEEAEAATLLKDRFVSLVAHDLRSPFAAILGLLELLEDDTHAPLSARHKEILGTVIVSCRNMVEMINDLLNITRIRTGRLTPRLRFVSARAVVDTAVQSMAGRAQMKGVRLESDVPRNLMVRADQTLMVEVLMNLVANAVKFSHPGQTVSVRAVAGDPVAFSVADRGVGVPPEFANDLFSAEVRTSMAGTQEEEGTGLGLPYCFDIMKAHGGSLSFVSEPGEGSVFTAALPLVRPQALVADDDEVVQLQLRTLLEEQGYVVRIAADGEEALRLAAASVPHLLLTDLEMAGMDGYELIRRFRSDPALASIPVAVLTVMEKDAQRLAELEINDFIAKPINPAEFVPRIRRFLR